MDQNGSAFRFTRAIVRQPAETVAAGLRAVDSGDPDVARFRVEHDQYCTALAEAGLEVIRLPPLNEYPDSVFVEDPVLVLPQGAVLLRPGAQSRAGEGDHLVSSLEPHRRLVRLPDEGFVDGGDILVTGREVIVGLSARTDEAGYEGLRVILEGWGHVVRCVRPPEGLLHLKTGCSLLDDETVLAVAAIASAGLLDDYELVELPVGEEAAANAIRVNDDLLIPAGYERSAELLAAKGYNVVQVPTEQAARLDGGLSCMSLRF